MTVSAARKAAAVLVWAICALPAQAQRGFGNQQFQRYPFDKWAAAENAKQQIRWTFRIGPASLSPHQRMPAKIHVSVDGDELRKHAGGGPIVVFVRIEDSAGHRYQTGNQTPMSRLHQGDRFMELDYDVSAFVLPGDYTVSLAVCDGRTLEHSFVSRRFHVAGLNPDPLPQAWNALPPVEFLPVFNSTPDAWYLPQLRSRIRLPLETQSQVRVELLVNTTPSELGSLNSFRRNMELIVPSLRVLTGIEPSRGSMGLTVLDISRHATSFEQADVHADGGMGLWASVRHAFTEFGGVTVDAKTLAGQRKMLDYFAGEAARRLGPADAEDGLSHALIVLSAPVYFTGQDKPPPPEFSADRSAQSPAQSRPGRRVFYISYSPMAILVPTIAESWGGASIQRPLYLFADDIERLLKPMGARVFRVSKPEEFRRALGAILDEIAKMPASR